MSDLRGPRRGRGGPLGATASRLEWKSVINWRRALFTWESPIVQRREKLIVVDSWDSALTAVETTRCVASRRVASSSSDSSSGRQSHCPSPSPHTHPPAVFAHNMMKHMCIPRRLCKSLGRRSVLLIVARVHRVRVRLWNQLTCLIGRPVCIVCGADSATEEQEAPPPRYRPDGLEALARRTNFSREELQTIYRGFKQVRTVFLCSPLLYVLLPVHLRITYGAL